MQGCGRRGPGLPTPGLKALFQPVLNANNATMFLANQYNCMNPQPGVKMTHCVAKINQNQLSVNKLHSSSADRLNLDALNYTF